MLIAGGRCVHARAAGALCVRRRRASLKMTIFRAGKARPRANEKLPLVYRRRRRGGRGSTFYRRTLCDARSPPSPSCTQRAALLFFSCSSFEKSKGAAEAGLARVNVADSEARRGIESRRCSDFARSLCFAFLFLPPPRRPPIRNCFCECKCMLHSARENLRRPRGFGREFNCGSPEK